MPFLVWVFLVNKKISMTDNSSQYFSKIQFLINEKQFDHALQLMQVYDEDLKKNYLYFFITV